MKKSILDLLQKDKPRIKEFYEAEKVRVIAKYQKEIEPINEILKELDSEYAEMPDNVLFVTNGSGRTVPASEYSPKAYWWERGEFVLRAKGKAMPMFDIYKSIRILDDKPLKDGEDYTKEYAHCYGDISAKAQKNKVFSRIKDKKAGDKQYIYGLVDWFEDGRLKDEYRK